MYRAVLLMASSLRRTLVRSEINGAISLTQTQNAYSFQLMTNSGTSVQVCDATGVEQSCRAGLIKIFFLQTEVDEHKIYSNDWLLVFHYYLC